MPKSKEYEIAFKLGAELESTFSRTFLNASKKLEETQKEADETQKAFDDLNNSLKNLASLGAAGITIGVTGLAAGATAAFMAVDGFDQSMNQIAASTGESAEKMAELEGIAKNLYKQNFGENWQDLGEAIALTESITGLAGKELENATRNAIAYRDVFKEDINESIKTTDTMMKNFGLSSEEAFNLLAQGAQNGLNKSGELLDSANEYAPQFSALGFSANEMFDTFSAGLEAGAFNLDKVGDAVKEFNIRVKDGSDLSQEAFEALNMDAEKMAQTFAQGGPEAQKAFKQVVQAISSIEDPIKKNEIGVALMGTQFEDLEADVVAAMGAARTEFDMTKATMEQINEVKYDSASQAIQGLWRQLEVGVVETTVLPKLQELSDYINQNMPRIEKWIEEAMNNAEVTFETFIEVINWTKANSDDLIVVLGTLAGTFAAFHTLSAVVSLWKSYQAITATTTVAQYALNLAMSLNPIGMLALAIGSLIGMGILLYQNWDTVKEKAYELWDSTKEVFGGIGEFIGGAWDTATSSTVGAINTMIGGVNALINAINSISIDIPDWVPKYGGSTFGVNIPNVPTIPGYADGGIVTNPHLAMVGEGGDDEVIIPINNSNRSQGLWETAGQMLRLNGQNGSHDAGIYFNPHIVIQGNADEKVIRQAISLAYSEFKRMMERYQNERKRLSLSN